SMFHSSPHLFLFFCYCSGPPLDLHSFPTRRSSDLAQTVEIDALLPIDRHGRTARGDVHRSPPSGWVLSDSAHMERASQHRPGYLDRKSTRLNSSHVAISYAVFCLKKKTNKISKTTI